MRIRVTLMLIAFMMIGLFISCDNSSNATGKIDVGQYQEKVREERQSDSITPEQREQGIKSIFPNIKDNGN